MSEQETQIVDNVDDVRVLGRALKAAHEDWEAAHPVARLECSKCGAEVVAACKCGAPYVPAGTRAAEAVAANPEKSDRAIAEEIGVSPTTVGKARKATVHCGQLKRTGKDGKARKLPSRTPRQATADLSNGAMVASPATAPDVDPPKINGKITAEPEAEPTIEAAEAEVKRLKALKAEIKANGSDNEIDPEKSAKALAEFKVACATLLPKMTGDTLQQAIDHFAEVVEIPASELMPDLRAAQIDAKIAKAEVAALKRRAAGKLPPRESRAAAWARLAGEAVANVEELIDYQQEFQDAKDGQPDSLQDGPFAQKCDEVCNIDLESALVTLQEAEGVDVPLGFGRD